MRGLVDFVDEHTEEVEYDLIQAGARLRDWPDNGVTWRDLYIVIRHAPPGSAVYRAVAGDEWHRTPELEFLREIEHNLRVLAWQNGNGKSHDYPEPIRLPWDPPLAARPDAMDWDEAFEWLGWSDPTVSLN